MIVLNWSSPYNVASESQKMTLSLFHLNSVSNFRQPAEYKDSLIAIQHQVHEGSWNKGNIAPFTQYQTCCQITLCAHSEEKGQWPDLSWVHRSDPASTVECDSPCLKIFTTSKPRGACTCNLAGTLVSWRSFLRLGQTVHQVSVAVCVSCRGILSNWSKTCWSEQDDPNVSSWAELGSMRTRAQSSLSELCSHCFSRSGHPRTLCSPTLVALHRFHATLLT